MSGFIGFIIWLAILYGIFSRFKKDDASKKNQTTINGKPVNRQSQTMEMVGSFVKENVAKFEKQASQWMESANAQSAQRMNPSGNGANFNSGARQQTVNRNPAAGAQPGSGYRTAAGMQSSAAAGTRAQSYVGATPKAQPYKATQEPTPDIVQRAKANTKKYEADETLHELEKEHKHSEHVSSAEASYVAQERAEHLKMHMEPAPRVEDESILGSIEDLMVKGYDGNLSFERDFVGEAMDMINRFTLAD